MEQLFVAPSQPICLPESNTDEAADTLLIEHIEDAAGNLVAAVTSNSLRHYATESRAQKNMATAAVNALFRAVDEPSVYSDPRDFVSHNALSTHAITNQAGSCIGYRASSFSDVITFATDPANKLPFIGEKRRAFLGVLGQAVAAERQARRGSTAIYFTELESA